jgi:carboxylesterase type B
MVSPGAKGLFHRAIMESNPITLQLKTVCIYSAFSCSVSVPLAIRSHTHSDGHQKREMQNLSNRFADKLGCAINDLACLQGKNVTAILEAQVAAITLNPLDLFQIFMPWQPYVDGVVIQSQPMQAFISGNYNQVPFMLGNVEDEGTIFIYEAFPRPLDLAGYKAVCCGRHGIVHCMVKSRSL